MTEEFEYQSYDLGQILALLQDYLDGMRAAHQADLAAFKVREKEVLTAYESWPYRDDQGAPEWHDFSPTTMELAQWQGVAWPKLLQELVSSLRNEFIVTGAEMTNGSLEGLPKQASLWKRLKHSLKRRVQIYTWQNCRHEIADRKGHNDAKKAHQDAYRDADRAWRRIEALREQENGGTCRVFYSDFIPPKEDCHIPQLQECAKELDALAQKQGDSPVLWLTEDESAFLKDGLSARQVSTVLSHYQRIIWGQNLRELLFLKHEREEHHKQYELERYEDPAFMKDVLGCLQKSETGASFLAFAERNGMQIHLNRRKHDKNTLINPCGAFYDRAHTTLHLNLH